MDMYILYIYIYTHLEIPSLVNYIYIYVCGVYRVNKQTNAVPPDLHRSTDPTRPSSPNQAPLGVLRERRVLGSLDSGSAQVTREV